MRIRPRAFLLSTLLIALAGGPWIPASSAATIADTFTGTIQTVSPAATTATGVVAGDRISGSFAYDSTQTGGSGLWTFTGSSKVHSFTFSIFDSSNNRIFNDSYSGNTTAYYAIKVAYGITNSPLYPGISGTQMDIMGDTIYKQGLGITGPGPPPAFDLTLFDPGNAGNPPSNQLPDSSASGIQNFVVNAGFVSWDPPAQTFTANVAFPEAVPEPSGLVLGIIGILTCTVGFVLIRSKPLFVLRGAGPARSAGPRFG
jgi:hypothetical protein